MGKSFSRWLIIINNGMRSTVRHWVQLIHNMLDSTHMFTSARSINFLMPTCAIRHKFYRKQKLFHVELNQCLSAKSKDLKEKRMITLACKLFFDITHFVNFCCVLMIEINLVIKKVAS